MDVLSKTSGSDKGGKEDRHIWLDKRPHPGFPEKVGYIIHIKCIWWNYNKKYVSHFAKSLDWKWEELGKWNNVTVMLNFYRHYQLLSLLMCYVLPTSLSFLAWEDTLLNGFVIPGVLRYVSSLNSVWLVNSVAHTIGQRPYDKYVLIYVPSS